MASSESPMMLSAIAGENLTIYKAVRFDASGQVTHTDVADGDAVDGIVMEADILDGQSVPIATPNGGRVPIEAGAVITPGQHVKANAAGEAIPATATDIVIGTYLGTVNAADGDIVEIQFAHKGALP